MVKSTIADYNKVGSEEIIDISTLDINAEKQSITGLGVAITGASALNLQRMTTAARSALIKHMFTKDIDNGGTGLNLSTLRVTIGCSDFSKNLYSYNETVSDFAMNNFNLTGGSANEDETAVISVLQEILNTVGTTKSMYIIATPWTAPKWMKVNEAYSGTISSQNRLKTNEINKNYAEAYARYLVKYIKAIKAASGGKIKINAITLQNEPYNAMSYPSMFMHETYQKDFVSTLKSEIDFNRGNNTLTHDVDILCGDNNMINSAYVNAVMGNFTARAAVKGMALHAYAGYGSELTSFHDNNTDKSLHLTEWSGNINHSFPLITNFMRDKVVHIFRNWAESLTLWNLALNTSRGPNQKLGTESRPVLTIAGTTETNVSAYTKNIDYYLLAHVSRFLQPGAVRIATANPGTQGFNTTTTTTVSNCPGKDCPGNDGLDNVAFKNPDNSVVVVVVNSKNYEDYFSIRVNQPASGNDKMFQYRLDAKSIATFYWTP